MAELADAQHLKCCGDNTPCGFESRPWHSVRMFIKKHSTLLIRLKRSFITYHISETSSSVVRTNRGLAQLVERAVWDREVVSSNLTSPTEFLADGTERYRVQFPGLRLDKVNNYKIIYCCDEQTTKSRGVTNKIYINTDS